MTLGHPRRWPQWWVRTALAVLALAVQVQAHPISGQQWLVSGDGQTVWDTSNRLIWLRCVEGMRWDGRTCRGTPLLLDHVQATRQARQRARQDGLPWRLPRSLELARLIDKGYQSPAVNPTIFPGTPPEWHWTMSITVNNPVFNPYNYSNIARGATPGSVDGMSLEHAWAVNFATGEASGTILRRSPLTVRLVRSAPAPSTEN